jgi:DNA-binding transcriptional LysR family regulator
LSHRSSKPPNKNINGAGHIPRARHASARKKPREGAKGGAVQPLLPPDLAGQAARAAFYWDDIHYFVELARRGRLLSTARRMAVAHTTVLRRIAALEKSLDRKLFKRSDTGMLLTDAGLELLDYAETMERAAHAIANHAGERHQPAGSVRVAMMEGMVSTFFVPRTINFQISHPGIVIELVTMLQIANLSKREADISISFVRPTGARLVTRRVSGCSIHLYAADSYLAKHGRPKSVTDLGKHHFVDYIDDIIFLPQLRWFRDSVDQKCVVFRSSSPMAQLAAVRSGIGIGMFPDYMVERTGLTPILPEQVSDQRELWLTTHQDLRNVPRVRAVFDYMKELFVQERGYLEGRRSEPKRPRANAGFGAPRHL